MNLPEAFDQFHANISLDENQTDRINSAAKRLIEYLQNHYEVGDKQVFLQGSYPNGTAISPDPEHDGGEYDVDLVSVSASPGTSPEEALQAMEDVLAEDGDLEKRIDRDPERPCVRLRYADDASGKFHVDVTPARPADGTAPLEIPRPGRGWHDTAPGEYTKWCQDNGPGFARTVQMLKRWRDHNQSARTAIKSIVLQVLCAQEVVGEESDAQRLAGTLQGIERFLAPHQSAPELCNPVLPDENLTERWEDDDFADFKRSLSDAVRISQEALNTDARQAHESWRKLVGKDFPPYDPGGSLPPPPSPAPGTRDLPQKSPSTRVEWG